MTTFFSEQVQCAVCGATAELQVLGSTNAIGSPDLDLRPPQMQRSTMNTWVQRCPECGFCNGRIDTASPGAAELVESAQYRAQLSDSRLPELANRFLCAAMVAASTDNRSAARAKLHAAWVCDDNGLDDAARECRRAAVDLLADAAPMNDTEQVTIEGAVVVDMLRRIGDFPGAAERCARLQDKTRDENLLAVLRFQSDLISAQDAACHRVEEAIS